MRAIVRLRFGHGEEFDVDGELSQVVSSLLSHQLVLIVAWAILVSEQEDALVETLLLHRFELLMARPKSLEKRRPLLFWRK